MKIAHFDTGLDWRGGQAQVLMLMGGLRDAGHASALFAPDAPLADRARAADFRVVRWRPRLDWDPIATLAAARALREGGFDVVHAHGARAHGSAALAGKMAGLPVVVSRRVPLEPRGNPLSRLKYRLGVDRYLCISRRVLETMRGFGIAEARLALVPSGIDLSIAPTPAPDVRAMIGAPPGSSVVGTVASLTAEKNHTILLEAAAAAIARLPDVRFVWLGEGGLRPELERRRARLGLERHVHLLGFREDAGSLTRQFTLLVQPSRFEGLGNAILEAMALGIPVIATRVGGVPELIDDGRSGRLVAPDDATGLAEAIVEAIEDSALRSRWAVAARAVASGFDRDRMIALTLEQYRDVSRRR